MKDKTIGIGTILFCIVMIFNAFCGWYLQIQSDKKMEKISNIIIEYISINEKLYDIVQDDSLDRKLLIKKGIKEYELKKILNYEK